MIDEMNGMKYVGQMNNLERRIKEHRSGKQYIDKAIQKYGRENFTVEVLEECATREQLSEREIFWIAALNTKEPNGYNRTNGGRSADLERTPEQCFNQSLSRRPESPFGNLVAEMKAVKMTNVAIARLLVMDPSLFSKKIRGKIKFTIKDIAKLEDIFKKLAKYLLKRDDGLKEAVSSWYKTPFKNLLNAILAHGFSYTSLAKLMGLPQSALAGKVSDFVKFSADEVTKLEEILKLPREILFARDDGLPLRLSKWYQTPFKNLAEEMKKHQFTQTALAKLMGLASRTLSGKIRGVYNFTAKENIKLEKIFGKPTEFLLKRFNG